MNNLRAIFKALLIVLLMGFSAGFQHASAANTAAIFGGDLYYTLNATDSAALKSSGFTTMIFFEVNVNSNGDLTGPNGESFASGGVYTGDAGWGTRLAALKVAPTSINRIEFCVGGFNGPSFPAIKALVNSGGTGSTSILYKNFQALKNATGVDAIDFDDETTYDVSSSVAFGNMLAVLGMKVTLCPYTNQSYWQSVKSQLGSKVDAIYLQCYDGGAGNDPANWITLFGGFKVLPGDWYNDSAATIQSKMNGWESADGITGGFIWNADVLGNSGLFSYAQAVLYGPGLLPPAPSALTATVTGNSTTLNWTALPSFVTSYKVKRSTVSGGPYTTIASNVTSATYTDNSIVAGTTYFYIVTAIDSIGEGPSSPQLVVSESYDTTLPLLTSGATIIGTPGSQNNNGNTIAKVFDNNISTFYDALAASGNWAGLDLGSGNTKAITSIRYCPRATLSSRMVGGVFQGSTTADFSANVTTLFTVVTAPPDNVFTTAAVSANPGYRYVRYLAPDNGWGNVSEIKFYGVSIPAAPSSPAVTLKDGTASVSWNAVATAYGYNVKRATVSGGPYTTVASNVNGLSFQNTGLTAATTYYYVISAINEAGEGANSTQVTASDTYSQWLAQNGYTPGAANTGFGQSVIGNGISNGSVYMDPAGLNVVPGVSNTTITALIRQDPQVTVGLWSSVDLATWTSATFLATADQSGVPAGFVRMQLVDATGSSTPKKFYRIKATR